MKTITVLQSAVCVYAQNCTIIRGERQNAKKEARKGYKRVLFYSLLRSLYLFTFFSIYIPCIINKICIRGESYRYFSHYYRDLETMTTTKTTTAMTRTKCEEVNNKKYTRDKSFFLSLSSSSFLNYLILPQKKEQVYMFFFLNIFAFFLFRVWRMHFFTTHIYFFAHICSGIVLQKVARI